MYVVCILLLTTAAMTSGQPVKCDQTPTHATVPTPREDTGLFRLNIAIPADNNPDMLFTPLQTYVLTIEATERSRPFHWFMITAEDPDVDNSMYDFGHKDVEVGTLKTLDQGKSRYSERCLNSVESYDNTDKTKFEIQWVSPAFTEKVRIRAMVAENAETWYTGKNLTIVVSRDNNPSKDTPPLQPKEKCSLCSEARYEVIFNGRWSRLTHPRHYPSKPDKNGYSHMIGASHDLKFTLWEKDTTVSLGMQLLAEEADVSVLEREIIGNMSEDGGTRTMIRGKRRHHPHMHEPSHALFRVDRIHHMFSIAVAMKPSPDWFLGTSKFELCADNGWLQYYSLPLYPWDAGTKDGVSYESVPSMTQPMNKVQRVEVGSFNDKSPFYQTNLNDLKPFAHLEVRRLEVYPLDSSECSEEGDDANAADENELSQDEPEEGPNIAESRQSPSGCFGEWSEWSPCIPDVGACGIGAQTRTRLNRFRYRSNTHLLGNSTGVAEHYTEPLKRFCHNDYIIAKTKDQDDVEVLLPDRSCLTNGDLNAMDIQNCIIEC